uniref:Ku domain-containing protein n=1 Tax=Glossina brevipalpis TaxID=37001 RepID=A0A1A9WFN6_9MUSC
MASWNPDYEISISDSEDEEDSLKTSYTGREALIFVVDANLLSEDPSRLRDALNLIRSAFLSGLLFNDKDVMGLVFANTDQNPEPFEPNCLEGIEMPDNCAVFLPVRQLTKAIVDHYLRFLETVMENFVQTYGLAKNGNETNFSYLLRLCLDLVRKCYYAVDNTTIVYLTDKEQPHPTNSNSYAQALQKAVDLKDQDVDFKLIPMVDEFNYDSFYKEFLSLVRDEDMESFVPVAAEKIREMLADRKLKQSFARRSLGHFKFHLGPDLALSAQYFNYFQKNKKPRKVLVQRIDNAIVNRKRRNTVRKIDSETQELGEPREINITNAWYEIRLGDHSLRLTYEQVNRVRNLHPTGMMLLGFQSKDELAKIIYCKPCNFMYPDDRHILGSKRLFRALWERCRVRDKVAICLFMSKRRSMPRYVALVPVSREDATERSYYSLLANDGFKIVYLPFTTYVRRVDFKDWNSVENQATDEGVAICEKLVRKLRLKYNPSLLSDPELDHLQTKLLALAFDQKFETEGSQYFPDPESQDAVIADLLPEFEEIFGVDEETAKKRGASTSAGTNPKTKVPKVIVEDLNKKDYVVQMINNKSLDSCTKQQLLQILEEHFDKKMAKNLKKQDLLDCIYGLNE